MFQFDSDPIYEVDDITHVPLFSDDRDLPEQKLREKRCAWLQRHDQDTCHLTSMLPLIKDLPVRLTDTINRNKKLYRGRRGRIVGWQLHPDTEKVYKDGECLLSRQPITIFVKFMDASWQIKDLEPGVYPLTQFSRTWLVNKKTQIQARRTGFFLIPDFSSTAHMIQGQTLPAIFADAQGLPEAMERDKEEKSNRSGPPSNMKEEKSNRSRQISAYISLSRVRTLDSIWMLQPFALSLFQQGPPPGPAILLDRLLNNKEETVVEAFERHVAGKPENKSKKCSGMKNLYECLQCKAEKRTYMLPATAFGADDATQIYEQILQQGALSRCLPCKEIARGQRAALGRAPDPALKNGFEGEDDATCGERVFKCGNCSMTKRESRFPECILENEGSVQLKCCNQCYSLPCVECKKERVDKNGDGKHCVQCVPKQCKVVTNRSG